LQDFEFFWVNSATGIHPDGDLIEIICTPPLQANNPFDWSKANMKHLAVKIHFSHIC
jgi:hypothetical protein